ELGKLPDAFEANRLAEALVAHASDATACHRLLRAVATIPAGDMHERLLADLERLASPQQPTPDAPHPKPPDAACVELGKAAGLDVGDPIPLAVRKRRRAWPSNGGSFDDWKHVFTLSALAWPDPRAVELSVRALELEAESSQ